jgi:hypothetical protein
MSPSHWVGAFAWWSMSGIIGAFIGGWAAGLLAEGGRVSKRRPSRVFIVGRYPPWSRPQEL